MKRYSYQLLLRQRLVVAALTLGLLAIMIGVGIELYLSTQRTTLPPTTQKLLTPLDPLLDLKTIDALEQKRTVTIDQAKSRVQTEINLNVPPATEEELIPTPTPAPPAGTPVPTPEPTPTPEPGPEAPPAVEEAPPV